MTDRQSHRALRWLASSVSLLVLSLLPTFSPAPLAVAVTESSGPHQVTTAAEPSSPLTVSLRAMTPVIAVPKAPITITGVVRNTGADAITSPVARALLGVRPLNSRQAVSAWAASVGDPTLAEVARAPVGTTLGPGALASFTLTIPASAISHSEAFGVLPLQVSVEGQAPSGTQERGDVNTFLPALAAVKAFEPMSIAWLVPLTLDPDPALHGTDSSARTTAWARAIGPGSRLDKLIGGTADANVTWAIDPAILGPPMKATTSGASAGPSPTPSASTQPTQGGAPDAVTGATAALAQRLRAVAPRHTLWSLPYADPDVSALLPLSSGERVLATAVSRPSSIDHAVGQARTDIAWPVEGTLTPQNETQLRRAFTAGHLAAAVTSASTLANRSGTAGGASRKSSAGLALLAYDDALSGTFTQTSSRNAGVITIQRFLADSMALLGERPGTRDRSVLIAAPRTFAGDPAVLHSLFAAVDKAPWLVTTTTDQLLKASETMAPEVPIVSTPGATTGDTGDTTPTGPTPSPQTATPSSGSQTAAASQPLSPGTSPLTSFGLETLASTLSSVTGIDSILDDGHTFGSRWADAQEQLVSARWRGHPSGPVAIQDATRAAIRAVHDHVNVSPSSVNFFADKGVLQVTVVNTLQVPIHGVHLALDPAQPRLRIEQQPPPLKIGARSRTNVPLHVTAIAAGLVRIDAALSTANGTPLGDSASVDVRVQPTSTWIYWVLGGLGGLVLVFGSYRSLRRGSTRASHSHAQEPGLHD